MVLLCSTLVSTVIYPVQIDSVIKREVSVQEARIQQRLVELQGTINDFSRRRNYNAIHREISRLAADPSLKVIMLSDANNTINYSSTLDYRGQHISQISEIDVPQIITQINTQSRANKPNTNIYFDEKNNWVIGKYEIKQSTTPDSNSTIKNDAYLLAIFDISHPIAIAKYQQEQLIIHQLLIYILVLSSGFLVLYSSIRSRINHIIHTAKNFVSSNYGYRVSLDGKDEFSSISRTFDQMADEIEHQHNDLTRLAHYDKLTQVLNRGHFIEQAEEIIENQSMKKYTLLFIDLDRFKIVNDTLGHKVGDEMLQVISQRLNSCIKETDLLGRLGGDEFIVLLGDTDNQEIITVISQRILQRVAEPLMLNNHPVSTTASIGVARYPQDALTAPKLIQYADIAMYQAKALGKNTYKIYDKNCPPPSTDALNLINHIRQSISHGLVTPHFQPIYDSNTGHMVSLEVLTHMDDGQGGLIPPSRLIPLIEDAGLMTEFTRVMICTAVAQYSQWVLRHQPSPCPRLSLNIASTHFDQETFMEQLDEILQETGVKPENLELEITEGTLLRNIDKKIELLAKIRKKGIHVAIDDFGTGYSSLSYLKKLPIDTLKIDRSFVADINLDSDDNAVIETIIAMAAKLELNVVAEGVETQDQLQFLHDHHCDIIQGFLYSHPLPLDQINQENMSVSPWYTRPRAS